jgi:hypothetical protein
MKTASIPRECSEKSLLEEKQTDLKYDPILVQQYL